jgi:hypothetical protein
MALFTTATDANKIIDSNDKRGDRLVMAFSEPAVILERSITDLKYRYVAMDYDSACTARDTLISGTPSGTQRTANVVRENFANSYMIQVYDIVTTDFAAV